MRFSKLLFLLLFLCPCSVFASPAEPIFCVASPGECIKVRNYWKTFRVTEAEVQLAENDYMGIFAVKLTLEKDAEETVYIRVDEKSNYVKDVRLFCDESKSLGVLCRESPLVGNIKIFSGSNPAKFILNETIRIDLTSIKDHEAVHVWSMSEFCEKEGEIHSLLCDGKIVMDRFSFSDPYESHMVLLSANGECRTLPTDRSYADFDQELKACPLVLNYFDSFPLNQRKAPINTLNAARYQIGDNIFFRIRYKEEP